MITDDGVEASDDRQAQDAGDEDSNYARPFGTAETKQESLGFLDANPIVKPRAESRLGQIRRFFRLNP